jgi:transcriptional regulator with XRE-family HTH domain
MAPKKNDSAIINIVAVNVRSLRKAAELSQEELAHEAGLDRTYISQVERQKRNVTIVVLAKIAAALDVTPDRLLVAPVRRRGT